ncbi:2-succinyl-5-enolpyruvyl-6-hydroxy-3-cyclohexene-1-carboxylic-acid synthase [Bhargavaea ullalensis]|uniref:2-succinyl-5-enolpyruvyl-6-hydroxy-3-cyclohexene-1-carboxylate synthase n=1 Tax=Bhargavaea ullalensis TaxID=1265685 RepID=A0ABV2GAK0_9BACL
MDERRTLTAHVLAITESLIRAGVRHVVVSPGSRSTPLAYAFAKSKGILMHIQTDERSAGFYALGLAKGSGGPVAMLCTSGTAASNYMPALTEAKYARIPLIAITADRPHELREVGAPQAIDQVGMYGRTVKYSVDFPLPEERPESAEFITRHVRRAVSIATDAPAGPVQLNVPFREPLLIDFEMEAAEPAFRHRFAGQIGPDPEMIDWFEGALRSAHKGMIVAGELPPGFDRGAFWRFAESLGWPVLADPLSGLRSEVPASARSLCISSYDAVLKHTGFAEKMEPDTVIRFGPQPVSKPLALFLKSCRPKVYAVVDDSPSFRDPYHLATHHLQCAPESLLGVRTDSSGPEEYARLWEEADADAAEETAAFAKNGNDEGAMAAVLFEEMSSGSDLFASSSMPIRDADTFFLKTEKDIGIFANRGANGIDGVVSTALGLQAARNRPAWLLIGDLAMLHDQNGLIATRFSDADLTIVVMNNDGGGIFSYLPQGSEPRYFEELFGTPTGLRFDHLAAMYGFQYDGVRDAAEFRDAVRKEKETPVRIIEAFSDRSLNLAEHRRLWGRISERLDARWKN